MANTRKTNRSATGGRPRSYSHLYKQSRQTLVNVAEQTSSDTVSAPSKRLQIDWSTEYGYIMSDLKRIGIVAGVLVVAMIVAGYVL
jgi:hypothetical protein